MVKYSLFHHNSASGFKSELLAELCEFFRCKTLYFCLCVLVEGIQLTILNSGFWSLLRALRPISGSRCRCNSRCKEIHSIQ